MAETAVRQYDWPVENLDCPSCAATLERACTAVPGVIRAKASASTGRLSVIASDDCDSRALRQAARRAGHPVRVDGANPAFAAWLPAGVGALLLAVGLLLEPSRAAAACYLVAALVGGATLPLRAWQALRQRNLDIHVLMTLALLGALGLGDWLEAALLTVLFAVARGLERGSLAGTRRAVESLLELAPRTARVERGGEVVEVLAAEVAVGERIRVRPGEVVPLDGLIVDGRTNLDEAAVTGESAPRSKEPGEPVFAATVALDGALTVEVTHPAGESTLARVVELVQRAEERPSPLARQVDRFAAVYTPAVVAGAALVAVLPALFGAPFETWLYRALVVLVLACPCALVLATPAAVFSGLTAAARRGILVRGGEPLERLAAARTIAFDKTGTLTSGQIRVATSDASADQLAVAAGLEAESTHPLAEAIRAHAAEQGIAPLAAEQHAAVAGRGVTGTVDGIEYRLGSPRMMAEAGIDLDSERLAAIESAGLTPVILAADRPLALFGLADSLRHEAGSVLPQLRALGCSRLVMLTGDQPRAAERIAAELGLSEVRAGLLPDEKQAAIAELQADGPVVMVGDGINDAPALAAADVGVALGAAGTDIALETAQVALMSDDLHGLPRLLRLARATRRVIVGNIVMVMALRLVLLPLALQGLVGLWLAVLADCGSAVLVTGNSLRLLRRRW